MVESQPTGCIFSRLPKRISQYRFRRLRRLPFLGGKTAAGPRGDGTGCEALVHLAIGSARFVQGAESSASRKQRERNETKAFDRHSLLGVVQLRARLEKMRKAVFRMWQWAVSRKRRLNHIPRVSKCSKQKLHRSRNAPVRQQWASKHLPSSLCLRLSANLSLPKIYESHAATDSI